MKIAKFSVGAWLLMGGHSVAFAQSDVPTPAAEARATDAAALDDITVTARRREESVQRVPDTLTVLSSKTIENAGIRSVSDFVDLTPNVTFRQGFRQGTAYITIRGITTAQQGWAPVTYLVDGVPAGSTDGINLGSLLGVERIEVLKGPQGALYGAGAIAGAINIVTKQPGEVLSGEGVLGYGNGNDRRIAGALSGPLLGQDVKFRLDASYQDSDGLQKTVDGQDANPNRTLDLRGRVIARTGPLTLDLRGHYVHTRAGAVYQEFLPSATGLSQLDDFSGTPGIQRGILGHEVRDAKELALKLGLELGFADLTSLTSYSDIEQNLLGTTSWQKPPAASFCGPVGGPGQAPDCFQTSNDNYRVFSQDLRLTSTSSGPLRWLIGTSYLERRALNALTVGNAMTDPGGRVVPGPNPFLQRIDLNHDHFFGVYGQVNYDLTDRLELTAALRYDQNNYNTTQYASTALTTPVATPDGVLTQRETDRAAQPKAQIAWKATPSLMLYASVSRGFRSGFFNSGNHAKAESTWNYEAGIKSEWFDKRLIVNLAGFHIDYSNQQFTSIISTPPYRATTNIPETRINGFEAELVGRPVKGLTLGASAGYTDARVTNSTSGPYTPKLTANLYGEVERPIAADLKIVGRVDYRYQGAQYLGTNDTFHIGDKHYLDTRLSLVRGRVRLTAYARNLLNQRQAFEIDNIGFGYIRYNSDPRSYGGELGFSF
jgi:iron complex outermembrane receptor protein